MRLQFKYEKTSSLILTTTLGVPALSKLNIYAGNNFGQAWRSISAASADQARIVYSRPEDAAGAKTAHIYIDSEFQSALLPSGYTVFCLTTGTHSLSSFVNDAPVLSGLSKANRSATGWLR